MKKTLTAIGLLIGSVVFAQQNEPDSIRVVLHEEQNGTIRVLDTIVPIANQQQLFAWMEANGWEAPPPPPPIPAQPMMFEQEIIIGDDSAAPHAQRMMFFTTDDSTKGDHPQVIMMRVEGVPGTMPPPPPGCRMKVQSDGQGGDIVILRGPEPPHAPGSMVTVDVTEKDTVIDGKTQKMIIRTERIILPEGTEAPPAPPLPPQGKTPPPPPAPPQKKQQVGTASKQDLLVYPNPASTLISVEFDVAAKEKTTLRVLDMNGKVVYSEEITDDNGRHIYREINLDGKGKGTYTVEVKSAKKAVAEKVILQ